MLLNFILGLKELFGKLFPTKKKRVVRKKRKLSKKRLVLKKKPRRIKK